MAEKNSEDTGPAESYKSPTEMFKGKLTNLLFECTTHRCNCYNNKKEKYAFAKKVQDLSIYLERYTPASKRKELYQWYKQLKDKIQNIRENNNGNDKKLTPIEMEDTIVNLEYIYAEEVHKHNQRILNSSPIIEVEVEGELDIDDEETISLIRTEKRVDDRKLSFKQ